MNHRIDERICPMCGKTFVPAPYHVYKDSYGRFYCTWGCFNKRAHRNLRSENHGGGRARLKVDQFTLDGVFIKTYPSIAKAASETGLSKSTIGTQIRGIHKPYKYIFRYHEEGKNYERRDETDTE